MKNKFLDNLFLCRAKKDDEYVFFQFFLFFILVFITIFYRSQLYFPAPFSSLTRLMLCFIVYFSVFSHVSNFVKLRYVFFILIGLVLLSGIHTFLQSGLTLAVHGTGRFANVMLFAPIASILLRDEKHLKKVFYFIFLIALIAYATLLFQFFGASMKTLVGDYIAIRGDLIRYMTLVGEPNVGGMLAVIVFGASILLIHTRAVAIIIAGFSLTWVFFSLSKASLIGLMLCVSACIAVSTCDRREISIRIVMSCIAGGFFLTVLGGGEYARVAFEAILGVIRGEPSVLEDFGKRYDLVDGHFGEIFSLSLFPNPLNYLFGASYSAVGSAAQEILGSDAFIVLPHNSYIEILLTGGIAMLVVVLFLMVRSFYHLASSLHLNNNPTERCALVCLFLLSAWMYVYPIIYEPVTGCLFWIIVGYGNQMKPKPAHIG